ncbi:MAG: Wzz/FepE/Etk N-terminal domain-containing protein [Candidatus Promineifilaceae bacterium]
MEIGDYLRILRQRGWLIILLAILTAAAAFAYSYIQPIVYESSLRLLVQPSRTDLGQAEATKSLLRGYVQWINSSYRAQAVINELKLDMTSQDLLGDVTVASDDSSFVIKINVENSDGDLANDIARTWGNLFVQWRIDDNADQRREDWVDAEFIDDPTIVGMTPNTKINTVAGAVFGALLGLIVIFVLEWIESGVVRRTVDVEKYLEIPVIGTIPEQQ